MCIRYRFTVQNNENIIVLRVNDSIDTLSNAESITVKVKDASLQDTSGRLADFGANSEVTITVPTITLDGDNPLSLTLQTDYAEPGFTAEDAEGNDITSDVVVANTVNKDVAGDYTVTYTVVDSNGLSASVSRDVTVA